MPRSLSENQAGDPIQSLLQAVGLSRAWASYAHSGKGGEAFSEAGQLQRLRPAPSAAASRAKRSRAARKAMDQLRSQAYASWDVGHRRPFHI